MEAEIERLVFDLGEEDALASLAEKLGVSHQAMAFRLFNLGTFAGGA